MNEVTDKIQPILGGSDTSKKTRLQTILEMRMAGFSLQSIANQFDLTRERVRQILLESSHGIAIKDLRRRKKIKVQQDTWDFVTLNWEQVKLLTVKELSIKLSVAQSKLRQILSPYQLTFLAANEDNTLEKKFSTLDCIKSLQQAQTYSFPLTTKSYSKLIASRDVSGPSLPLLLNRFGSWRDACKIAGVEAGEAARELYDQQFTNHEILCYIRNFMASQLDGSWSIERYVEWREQHCPEAPSIASVRNRIGNWPQVRVEALELNVPGFDMDYFKRPNFDN